MFDAEYFSDREATFLFLFNPLELATIVIANY